ncbi:MAG: hypothetical protein D3911_05755 [Candidatus Electrothrix sp. AW3_4]|nr:hypothetical protein [Candidatus Electrothrix gigas]
MKKLPIGISTLSQIIEGGYVYIDKTREALELIENYKYVFLSRPRRFGKSLFLDTLAEIFSGNKELFNGLYIRNKYDFESRPVIRMSFGGNRSVDELKAEILANLLENKERLQVTCRDSDDYALCFRQLIQGSYKKYQQGVVILIDEYDKAILDNLDQLDVALKCREILKRLYSQMKECDRYIRFVFLTGVSKFTKTSIFSGLNNLEDISLVPDFAQICGYSEKDVQQHFPLLMREVDFQKVTEWYNGYNFSGTRVFNPFDILLFIKNNYRFRSYWFETGTPSFLVKLIREKRYYIPNLEHLEADSSLINSFNIEDISLESVLFQSGYLTIDHVENIFNNDIYHLTFPNKEVRLAFNNYLIKSLLGDTRAFAKQKSLYRIFMDADLASLEDTPLASPDAR